MSNINFKEKKLIKNTIIIAIGQICTKFISFFMLPLYTSLLSNEEYGKIDLITTFISLAVIILTFQLEQGLFRFLVDYRGNKEKQKEYISTSIIFIFFINLLIGFILILILFIIKYEFTFYLISIIVSNVFLSLILQIPRGIGKNIIYTIASFISGSLNVILNVVFILLLNMKVEGMLLATLISNIMSCVFIIFKIKLWRFIRFKNINKSSFIVLMRYSCPLIPNTLCWWVVNASDRLIIANFIGVAANGIYSVANKFPSLFSLVTNIFQTSWTESTAENIYSKDEYIQKTLIKTIKFYSSVNLGIIVILPFIFNFLIDSSFNESYYYIPILMTGACCHGIANLYGSIYTALKFTNKMAKTTIMAALINIVVNILLIKYIGLYAASISTLIAYAIIAIIRHNDVKKNLDIKSKKICILTELIIYIIVFISYYSKLVLLQLFVLLFVAIYAVITNRKIIQNIFYEIQKKFRIKS